MQKVNPMKLISYDEYQKIDHETPYLLKLQNEKTFLYFFGERHSFNPDDAQWIKLKEFWDEFLLNTNGKKRIVLIEGGMGGHFSDEKQAILKEGGMGLTTLHARKENIEIHSPEPDYKYERAELEKEFSREEIQFFYFAREVDQWCRYTDPKPDFETYIGRYLLQDQRASQWDDFDFSLESMKRIHTSLFQTEFDQYDRNFWYSIVIPFGQKAVTNKVSVRSGDIRDEYMVKEMERYIKEGYSMFGQFGASHVVRQEPALKGILAYSL